MDFIIIVPSSCSARGDGLRCNQSNHAELKATSKNNSPQTSENINFTSLHFIVWLS